MTKIILFDVDQTLLYSGGAGSLAMRRAFEKLYGIEDGFRRVEFSGRTDWGILRDAMHEHGLLGVRSSKLEARRIVNGDDAAAFRREMARFQETYYSLLPGTLREVSGGCVMPGVADLLAGLAGRTDIRIGLATGNFRRAAFIKLDHFGLDGYLADGGFGDDAEDRSEVVRLAIERVGGDKASPFPPREGGQGVRSVWVIGDTPLDVAAAHANGARALGVATGATSAEELLAVKADAAVEDLSDTAAVVRTVTE